MSEKAEKDMSFLLYMFDIDKFFFWECLWDKNLPFITSFY